MSFKVHHVRADIDGNPDDRGLWTLCGRFYTTPDYGFPAAKSCRKCRSIAEVRTPNDPDINAAVPRKEE